MDVKTTQNTYPGEDMIQNPLIELTYTIDIHADPAQIWPWIIQMGYNRGGWYIDTWWDRFNQDYIWPRLVPKEARGQFCPPADEILPEYKDLQVGDTILDGPPGTAYYNIVGLDKDHHLILHSTSHFKYMVPGFLVDTRFEPSGEWSWAFILEPLGDDQTLVTSHWRGTGGPGWIIALWKPLVHLADRMHQPEILRGMKRRVEGYTSPEKV